MKIDFNSVDQVTDYVTVPAGTYLCKIAEVQTGTTRNGDERWGIRLVVAEGEYVGRQAAWDGLVFSARGMARVQRILGAIGLPSRGTVDVQPEDLVEAEALVEVRPVEYQAPGTDTVVRRNEVPFDGYRRVPRSGPQPAGDDESLPF